MSKQHEIVVVAGLSGVGKSHLINELKKGGSQFVHFSAGSLIKKRRNLSNRDELRLLGENEILQNQYLLVNQLKEELESLSDRSIVLFDAHMVIDSDESILEIPFEIFEKLNPSRFILLCCEPEVLLSRREKDSSRLRPLRSVKKLNTQQELSRKLAEEYAARLSIPFSSLASDDVEILRKEIFPRSL